MMISVRRLITYYINLTKSKNKQNNEKIYYEIAYFYIIIIYKFVFKSFLLKYNFFRYISE